MFVMPSIEVTYTILVIIVLFTFSFYYVQDAFEEKEPVPEMLSDCSLNVMENKMSKMPVIFISNGQHFSILYPDADGAVKIRNGHHIRLLCAKSRFLNHEMNHFDEIVVACESNNTLRYKKNFYRFHEFECLETPKSELIVSNVTCQQGNTVASVGFQAKNVFLTLYKVCFDRDTENSLYTWYEARSPYFNHHQLLHNRPPFTATHDLFGKTNVNMKYSFKEQKKTLAKILKSYILAAKYIYDSKHSMSRGHYAAKADFMYSYEQKATFYYANVAPQWQIFNGDKWAKLEENTRYKMDHDRDVHVIVTGSFGSCTLPDVNGKQQPLFLDLPDKIPVPLFFWKLFYDKNKKDGTVYIGLNNPYMKVDDSLFLCPNTCPKGFKNDGHRYNEYRVPSNDANEGLIYCCSLESFEKVYGKLDPIVFQENN